MAELTPLPGGYSGEMFVATDPSGERTAVRIYGGRSAARGPDAVEVDAALLELLRGIVPVPRVLEVRRPAGDRPAVLVTSFEPGEPLAQMLPGLAPDQVARVAQDLVRVLDRLRHIPTRAAGCWVGSGLAIEPWPSGAGLVEFVAEHRSALAAEGGAGAWRAADLDRLTALAERAQGLLDVEPRTVLVHSDFNPKNILVDPDSLLVTAVLDWEFSHSGSSYTDVGNLLRFSDPVLTRAVVTGLSSSSEAPEALLARARAADLFALVDLAARPHPHDLGLAADRLLRDRLREADQSGSSGADLGL